MILLQSGPEFDPRRCVPDVLESDCSSRLRITMGSPSGRRGMVLTLSSVARNWACLLRWRRGWHRSSISDSVSQGGRKSVEGPGLPNGRGLDGVDFVSILLTGAAGNSASAASRAWANGSESEHRHEDGGRAWGRGAPPSPWGRAGGWGVRPSLLTSTGKVVVAHLRCLERRGGAQAASA